MSEYQYFEFAAVDRRLSQPEQAELRRYSSRARITASSFCNEYHWGDFKGDADDWMERYFDIHVHFTNWGTRVLMLRLPAQSLPSDQAAYADQRYGRYSESCFSFKPSGDDYILTWRLENEDSDDWGDEEEDSSGWLPALLPLRDELRRGDTRALYLGWLLRVCTEEIADDEEEPPLPAGLQTLTPAQQALVDFMQIDSDWLSAVATASPSLEKTPAENEQLAAWLNQADASLLKQSAQQLLQGDAACAENTLRHAYNAWRKTQIKAELQPARRSVETISQGVEAAYRQRTDKNARQQAAAQARAAAERAARLARLAAVPDAIWAGIDQTLQTKSGRAYDLALQTTSELAEALSNAGRQEEFRQGLARLLQTHGSRKTWVDRLRRAGLY
ncbi:MAG: hypothetical protein LWW81_14420 [Rhodocyclales bacterium]|nr:hypothetical protein [Rhodocyclales bacterium]